MMVQRMILKQLCISKGTHAAGPIFLLKANHGFIETEKIQHVGAGEEPLTLIFTDVETFKKHEESVKRLEAQKTKDPVDVRGHDWTDYSQNPLTSN